MQLTQKSVLLLIVAALLLVLNLVDQGNDFSIGEELPALAAVAQTARRLEISTATQKVILQRDAADAPWQVTAPFEAKADQARVDRVLAAFVEAVPMDVRIDQGNLEEYGLDTTHGIIVEAFGDDEDAPLVSYTLGFDAQGGSSFIRLSGDDAVYRARVGGRFLVEQPPIAWRNQVLMDFDPERAVGVEVERSGTVSLRLVRGESPGVGEAGAPLPGEWALDPTPEWPMDQRAATQVVNLLGNLRAAGILRGDFEAGFDQPLARIRVTLDDGVERTMIIGGRLERQVAFARIEGEDDIYQIARQAIEWVTRPPEIFRERNIFAFSVEQIDTFAYLSGSTRIILQRNEDTGAWTALQPANMGLDIRQIQLGVRTFADLRAMRLVPISPEQAGLVNPTATIRARFYDGQQRELQIGGRVKTREGVAARYVRRTGDTQIYLLIEEAVQAIQNAFGRT
ncbi:MAG: DUF4340 domain-containing protein [Myxococcota bacterium]